MKMVKMARSKAEQKAREKDWKGGPAVPDAGENDGPRLHLDDEHMTKVGMKQTPATGDEYAVQAQGRVHEVHDMPGNRHVVVVLHTMGAEPKNASGDKNVRADVEAAASAVEKRDKSTSRETSVEGKAQREKSQRSQAPAEQKSW